MNFLTCCEGGNCRSVALAMLLKLNYGERDVLAMGLAYTSDKTKTMLFEWADKILVVGEQRLLQMVPKEYRDKVEYVDIGQDRWSNPFNLELLKLLDKTCQKWIMREAVEQSEGYAADT